MPIFLMLPGCADLGCCLNLPWQDQDSQHYLIIGIGIVSIPKPKREVAVLATQVHSLGVNISDQPGTKLGVGYTSGSVIAIPENAEDVRVEVSQHPGGKIIVETTSALLKNHK